MHLHLHLRSLFPSRSPSPVPSPVPSSSSSTSSSNPSSTSTSRCPSPCPGLSLSAPSLSKPLPPLPGPGSGSLIVPGPVPAPSPDDQGIKPQPKRKISAHRVHQLNTLLAVLNLTKLSLRREQDSLASILHASTVPHLLRTPSPDSQDIDLLALASNACRARRYRTEEQVRFVGVQHWQGTVDELGRTIGRLESELEGLERERRVLEESW